MCIGECAGVDVGEFKCVYGCVYMWVFMCGGVGVYVHVKSSIINYHLFPRSELTI